MGAHRQAFGHPLRTAAPIGQHPATILAGERRGHRDNPLASVCCFAREDGAKRCPAGKAYVVVALFEHKIHLLITVPASIIPRPKIPKRANKQNDICPTHKAGDGRTAQSAP